jgi:uncharacterized damage-inducible protein DinB
VTPEPESQRRPVPRDDTGELDTALAFLRFARESALRKTEGLDDEQLRRVLVPTGTTLLGLVRHLTDGERFWFGHHLTGVGAEPDWDAGMQAAADASTEAVLAGYRAAAADSDAAIAAAGSMDALSVGTVDGARTTLRWVLAHMTSETARHAGHADILRELVDGTTGR